MMRPWINALIVGVIEARVGARASCECGHWCGWFVRIEGLGLNWNGVDVLVECGWRVERLADRGRQASA